MPSGAHMLTDDEIEELFQQLNAVVPTSVLPQTALSNYDCDRIREEFEAVGLERSRKAQIQADLLVHAHGLGLVGRVSDMMMGMTAEAMAASEQQMEMIRNAYSDAYSSSIPFFVADPKPPTARELVRALKVHPKLKRRVFRMLAHDLLGHDAYPDIEHPEIEHDSDPPLEDDPAA